MQWRRAPAVGVCAAAIMATGCASTAPTWPADAPRAYAPVIERDAYGVPTIRGATDADVAYGIAYAHAEDDFENLQRQILTARGRMAARFGRDGAGADFLYHLIDVRARVEEGYARDLAPETRAILEAYAAGVNAFAAAHPDEVWRDARNVTGRDIVAGFVHNAPIFWGFDSWLVPLTDKESHPCAPRPLGPRIEDRGSNAFAVAPSRAEDGHTRLIVNSHQPWTGPVAWWELRIESGEGWRFHGGTFSGSPVPFVGHNGALGYAATVNYPDLADYYRLTTDASHPGQYLYDGAWRDFETRRVTIQVKLGPITMPVSRTLHYSVHGPAFETGDGWVAVRAAGLGDVRGVEQYYRMSRARDFAAWQDALAMQGAPSTNLIYADAEGHIGFFYNARFPDRPASSEGGDYDWRHCAPGDTSAALWTAYLPPDAAPRLIDPPSGWLYSANASPFSATDPAGDLDPGAYSETLGIERWMTNRALRTVEQLSPQAQISDAVLLAAKFDIAYSARSSVSQALDALIAADVGADGELQRAQALLRDWDRVADADATAMALAYYATQPYLRARWRREPPPDDPVAALRAAVARMQESFGRIDPPWGEVLRLKRGDVDLALEGGPDLLRAVTFGAPENGKLVGVHGDGLIIVVDWPGDGTVRTRTVSQFGAAAERPGSPHYNDQAEIFARYGWRYDETERVGE